METEFGSIKNEVDTKYNKTCPGAGVINDWAREGWNRSFGREIKSK